MALLMMGTAQESMAQQRKSVTKSTAVRKSAAKKPAAKKPAVKKPVAAPATVTIDDPVIVNGHVAFLGVPVKQAVATIKEQLKEKGFVDTNENGFQYLLGTAFGVKVKVFVSSENQIETREAKGYTLNQVKTRVNAYKKAFVEATGGKATENCMGCPEDGGVSIETTGGTIEIHYYNQDEVNFESKYFDIVITYTQY